MTPSANVYGSDHLLLNGRGQTKTTEQQKGIMILNAEDVRTLCVELETHIAGLTQASITLEHYTLKGHGCFCHSKEESIQAETLLLVP